MFGLFRKKTPGTIVLTLNARLQPMHRAELEDAFDQIADREKLGARVVGGGTALSADGEVENCDIEVSLDDCTRKTAEHIAGIFGAMLAPHGSRVTLPGDGGQFAFGSHEGLALYLNGTDLPDEVYASCDANHVHDECIRLLDGAGMVHSHWQGPTESALYMYGRSFEEMHARIAAFIASYPLCRDARVVRIA
ncbi:hypothetical protein [Xanthomonas sp. XNM01]|uniref:hypothetical protein n=1 Tax=Xanthomonas sp. XNM01 TaxID=2769289 RepID=UPI00178567FB|nr:hypothetical protein [Xanthomonas sp. XNM01]MBD9367206.1 hypothetical protein [Xanthomonas sp. XNM01]